VTVHLVGAGPGDPGLITVRGLASQTTIASGHDPDALDYDGLARTPGTLVFFMGLAALETIARRLVAHGRSPRTPAAVIAAGTTDEQRSVVAALSEIAAAAADLEPPALVVIGEVVTLAERLAPQATLLAAAE